MQDRLETWTLPPAFAGSQPHAAPSFKPQKCIRGFVPIHRKRLPNYTHSWYNNFSVKSRIRKMDLFGNSIDSTKNLLPKDGTVNYYGKLFARQQADHYYNQLLTGIEWKNDEAFIMGKLITTKRKVAWYGDTAFEYSYSNRTKTALPW